MTADRVDFANRQASKRSSVVRRPQHDRLFQWRRELKCFWRPEKIVKTHKAKLIRPLCRKLPLVFGKIEWRALMPRCRFHFEQPFEARQIERQDIEPSSSETQRTFLSRSDRPASRRRERSECTIRSSPGFPSTRLRA